MKLLKEDGDFRSISGPCCKIYILLSFAECVWGPGCDCVYLELLDRPARGLPRALAGSRSRLWEANCCTPRRYVCLCMPPWSEAQIVGAEKLHSKRVWCVCMGVFMSLRLQAHVRLDDLDTVSRLQVCQRKWTANCFLFFRFLSSVAWTCDIHQKIMHYVCLMITLCDSSVRLRDLFLKKFPPPILHLTVGHLSVTALLACVLVKFEPTNNQRCKLGMYHILTLRFVMLV